MKAIAIIIAMLILFASGYYIYKSQKNDISNKSSTSTSSDSSSSDSTSSDSGSPANQAQNSVDNLNNTIQQGHDAAQQIENGN